ncbi:MAG: hypothetical protein L0210_00820 [Rhodospirillales bacterium]|nr:hypothetical protein [Rhodospirillales bacterium]
MTSIKKKRRRRLRGPRLLAGSPAEAAALPAVAAPSPPGEPPTSPLGEPPSPPEPESRKLARRHTDQAFRALASVMKDRNAAATARVAAANTILEWGHGKRGETASNPEIVETVVDLQWADE